MYMTAQTNSVPRRSFPNHHSPENQRSTPGNLPVCRILRSTSAKTPGDDETLGRETKLGTSVQPRMSSPLTSMTSLTAPAFKKQFAEAGWVMEYLETAPVKIVIHSGLRIFAIYGEVDPKNSMSLYRWHTDLRPRNRHLHHIVIVIQNSNLVPRTTIPLGIGMSCGCAPVVVH